MVCRDFCIFAQNTMTMNEEMTTDRLLLRPWREADADSLYKYAQDPAVGLIAGWPPHASVEESLHVIRTVFSAPEVYAIVLRETLEAVGSIGILPVEECPHGESKTGEAEIGYWIGKPYWGRGLMTEAMRRLLRRCFEELEIEVVWCVFYEGNTKSRRVMEKCGFRFHHKEDGKVTPLGDVRTEHHMRLTREEWEFAQRQQNNLF